jgi:hypothetical protein
MTKVSDYPPSPRLNIGFDSPVHTAVMAIVGSFGVGAAVLLLDGTRGWPWAVIIVVAVVAGMRAWRRASRDRSGRPTSNVQRSGAMAAAEAGDLGPPAPAAVLAEGWGAPVPGAYCATFAMQNPVRVVPGSGLLNTADYALQVTIQSHFP